MQCTRTGEGAATVALRPQLQPLVTESIPEQRQRVLQHYEDARRLIQAGKPYDLRLFLE